MLARINGEAGQRESVVSTKRPGMASPTLYPGGTVRENPFSTWEKALVYKRAMILLRTGYIIYHNLYNLFRAGYIIFRAQ